MSGGARAGLFRAIKQSRGWEDARNHQASKVTKPPHHKGHQVGPKSHFSQRVSSALSLLGTKGKEFCRHFFSFSFHKRELERGLGDSAKALTLPLSLLSR